MRIAVFSDIHGNPHACEAVLDEIKRNDGFDEIIAVGDLCLGGSDPGKCLKLLQENNVSAVYGNTEQYILHPDVIPPDELHRSMWERVHPVACWIRDRLSDQQIEWLTNLPFRMRFNPGNSSRDELLVVHANPNNVELMIFPEPEEQLAVWGEIGQPDNDAELLSVFKNEDAGTVVFGHLHYSFTRLWNQRTLVDIAPCSMPSIDHDPRARFSIIEWNGSSWNIEQYLVEYDPEKEIAALTGSDMPFKDDFIKYFV